jgi:sigma-B regulation protein RsbU (phosphoserine phosphatase)
METRVLERFRESVWSKRTYLTNWMLRTPSTKKHVHLGPASEDALKEHLDVLDRTAEKAAAGSLGVCTVCHEHVEAELLEMDYTASVCLEHLSEAQARKLEAELELAQAVQRSLLPHELPDSPHLQTAAFSQPAQIVGGDYFGFYHFQNDAEGLAIADVAGHGVAASLHMASVHALLHTLVPTSDSPADVLKEVHRLFVHNVHFTTFVTAFLSAYDPKTRLLTYCNAGHNPPLLLSSRGNGESVVHWLRPTSPAIGLVEDARYAIATVNVQPGDLMVLYTDGVTETTDAADEEFGDERLASVVQHNADASAGEILYAVRRELEHHSGGQPFSDDTTIVVQKIVS